MKITKKIATKLHEGTRRKKICVICVICGFSFFISLRAKGAAFMRNYHEINLATEGTEGTERFLFHRLRVTVRRHEWRALL